MSGIGSYSIQQQNGLYLNPTATQSHFLVKTARIRSIGTKTGAASMPRAVGVAQSKLFFSLFNRCSHENYPNYPNDKKASGFRLWFSNVNVKNAVQ
jgi:hypothetical protein